MDYLDRNFNTETVDNMARVTLNGGSVKKLDDEDQKLIDAYLAKNSVTVCQPACASGNEASRGTKSHIAKERRKFRKDNK